MPKYATIRLLWVTALAVIAVNVFASVEDFDAVPVSRWVEGGGARLKTPDEIRATWQSDLPFRADAVRSFGRGTATVCIVVNEKLYPTIEAKLNGTFAPDVAAEGYAVSIFRSAGGTPADLRNFLINQSLGASSFTIILIGNLPVPLFEIAGGFENGVPFPCDLFYMDLDGTWADVDYDGFYDTHEGAVEADARMGRLTAGPLVYLGKTEADLVNHYLDKNHAYRTGQLRAEDKALAYVDDDWAGWGYEWRANVAQAYPSTDLFNDTNLTWDTDYETRLKHKYESILVCVHSNPVLHQFVRPGPLYGYTYMTEICNIKPEALFYNLFACSNARYTESNYMGGWYTLMDNNYGLAAVGSAKTGGMLHFGDYYEPLGDDKPMGEAFRYWMALWADSLGTESRDWHYGMTLIGDPTLRIRPDHFLDVAVSGFTARAERGAAVLSWEYNGARGPVVFNIYRSTVGRKDARRVNAAPVAGRSPLAFVDDDVAPGGAYRYDLEAVENGRGEIKARATLKTGDAKTSLALSPAAPNPATSFTRFRYALVPGGGEARLRVYDLAGRLVRSLPSNNGDGVGVVWNLDGDGGDAVPPGLYVVILEQGEEVRKAPVVVTGP